MADEEKSAKRQQKRPAQEKAGEKGGRKRRPDNAAAAAAQPEPAPSDEPEPKVPPRLRVRYEQEIVPALMRELKIDNRMRVPRLEKIVINMALGEARDNV